MILVRLILELERTSALFRSDPKSKWFGRERMPRIIFAPLARPQVFQRDNSQIPVQPDSNILPSRLTSRGVFNGVVSEARHDGTSMEMGKDVRWDPWTDQHYPKTPPLCTSIYCISKIISYPRLRWSSTSFRIACFQALSPFIITILLFVLLLTGPRPRLPSSDGVRLEAQEPATAFVRSTTISLFCDCCMYYTL